MDRRALALSALVGGLLLAQPALAVDDTQSFTVTVPSVLTITAPAAASITHDQADTNQAFGSQSWGVACNDPDGGSVTFTVSAPFTHVTDVTYKADTKLDLAITASDAEALWVVTTASDQTDYSNIIPDNDASVAVASSNAGDATFGLTVTLLSSDFSILAAGDYQVTVTGTLTAN